MNLEGKVYGYEKKTLGIIVLLVIVAGVMFYAGAKYEKRKLDTMGLLKTTPASTMKKTPTTKTKPSDNNTTPGNSSNMPSDQSNAAQATPSTTTPTTTPDLQN